MRKKISEEMEKLAEAVMNDGIILITKRFEKVTKHDPIAVRVTLHNYKYGLYYVEEHNGRPVDIQCIGKLSRTRKTKEVDV